MSPPHLVVVVTGVVVVVVGGVVVVVVAGVVVGKRRFIKTPIRPALK